MEKNMDNERELIWQEEENCSWKSDKIQVCSYCGKKTMRVVEIKLDEEDEGVRVCFLQNRDCFRNTVKSMFIKNIDIEYLLIRSIEFQSLDRINNKKKRDPIGLSLRFNVMKRDGFQCVLCGDSGAKSKLEIDHIIPVSEGGLDKIENLQTLCFKCNRGKGVKSI